MELFLAARFRSRSTISIILAAPVMASNGLGKFLQFLNPCKTVDCHLLYNLSNIHQCELNFQGKTKVLECPLVLFLLVASQSCPHHPAKAVGCAIPPYILKERSVFKFHQFFSPSPSHALWSNAHLINNIGILPCH